MGNSKAPYPDFDREEVAEAFASTLSERFSQNPKLRDSEAIGVTAKTLSKWERGEDLPGFVTAASVLSFVDGWILFASKLEHRDRRLTASVDQVIEALASAQQSLALHPPARERRAADDRLIDADERIARLRRLFRKEPTDEIATTSPRLVPRDAG